MINLDAILETLRRSAAADPWLVQFVGLSIGPRGHVQVQFLHRAYVLDSVTELTAFAEAVAAGKVPMTNGGR